MIKIEEKEYQNEAEAIADLSSGFMLDDLVMWTPDKFKYKNENDEYVIPKKKWPIFYFKQMSAGRLIDVQNKIDAIDGDEKELAVFMGDLIKDSLADIKNVPDKESYLERPLDRMSVQFMAEMARAIITQNKLSTEELEGLE